MPIDFMRGEAGPKTANGTIAKAWLGMNCAACHTGQIEYDGKRYLIDGAPAMADFQAMFESLVQAMQATLADDAKFGRFARAVMAESAKAGDGGTMEKDELLAQLVMMTQRRDVWNQRNKGASPYGYARLDAVVPFSMRSQLPPSIRPATHNPRMRR